jgi:O-antigen/teichoic acid export membrane protein
MALVIQRLLAFGYFSYAAIAVGPAGLGSFTVAVNLAMAAGALADLGLANVLTP